MLIQFPLNFLSYPNIKNIKLILSSKFKNLFLKLNLHTSKEIQYNQILDIKAKIFEI